MGRKEDSGLNKYHQSLGAEKEHQTRFVLGTNTGKISIRT